MRDAGPEEMSDEEVFENSYFYFVDSLQALASPPEVACERYGHFNVAWEIKDDVSRGVYLAESPVSRLSARQAAAIKELADELSRLPENVIRFTKVIEKSLENMRHPAWVPIRAKAARLVEGLRQVTETNKKYFSGK